MKARLRVAGCGLRVGVCFGLGGRNALAADHQDIPPLLPPHVELQQTFWELHGWQCVLAAVVFLALVIIAIIWLRRTKPLILEPPADLARHALEQLRGQTEDGALVMNVSRILKGYILTMLKLPPKELTTTEFRRVLRALPQINPDLAALTGDFLRRCDQWKFAPERPTPKLGAVEGALALVEKIESSQQPVAEKETVL